MKHVLNALFCCAILSVFAQNTFIDVKHYSLQLAVNDVNNNIQLNEKIRFVALKNATEVRFDLTQTNEQHKGMFVKKVVQQNKSVRFRQLPEQLILEGLQLEEGLEYEFYFELEGIPTDGLVIGKNKFNQRTFFGDNWPNRAHNWFACNDHPSDKATIEYEVEVPSHYQVIANGLLESKVEAPFDKGRMIYRYATKIPLPTKVCVVGIAAFEVENIENEVMQLSSWVYPENKKEGFYDFQLAPQILVFYMNYIGKYPYEKLANVQSTTRFGGMENASCIFYDENAINGKRTCEALMAHEIAHQWFGNCVTEKDWPHIWLSEGFATYFTNLYLQQSKGEQVFDEQLKRDRSKALNFSKKYQHPVVDSAYTDLMDLLNPHSYQKGGWVLHQLRREIGDSTFQKVIQTYYNLYQNSNANSEDFERVAMQISGKDLHQFFHQWLRVAGHPTLKVMILNEQSEIQIKQVQAQLFEFPISLLIEYEDGTSKMYHNRFDTNKSGIIIKVPKKVKAVKLDPNVDLFFEEVN
jgi:aminopeptidase N